MPRSILFAIDVEPDGRATVREDPWEGAGTTIRELAVLRSQLQAITQTPVRFNWFVRTDPQIEQTWGRADWAGQACPQLLEEIARYCDFTGIHPHFWKWHEGRGSWFSEFNDTNWLAHCIRTAIGGYRELFGARPLASRCGDRWFSDPLVPLLEAEGICYDLTIEPDIPDQPIVGDPDATSWMPDYRNAPRQPYQPSSADFLVPALAAANHGLWIVPMTTSVPVWAPVRRFPFFMKTSRSANLVLHPRPLWKLLAAEISRPSAVPLAMVLRSGDLANATFHANFRYVAERLVRHAGLQQCQFLGVAEAMNAWTAQPTSPLA